MGMMATLAVLIDLEAVTGAFDHAAVEHTLVEWRETMRTTVGGGFCYAAFAAHGSARLRARGRHNTRQ
ncbi:MAG: hypothetical protein Q27BB25_00700 [Blastomonas sp. CACIA14H2]|nr:MAG: hypothetical protein Q27BB25_00700 [Blastomonas sp. CACIA14H2]